MYGTIFNLRPKPGRKDDLLQILDIDPREGMVAWFLMDPDDQSRDLIGVAIFESKEAHIANANSPEQNAMFTQIMDYLEAEPTWTDGSYVIGRVATSL